MNDILSITKSAMIRRPEGWNIGEVVNCDTLDDISTHLWLHDIEHDYTSDNDGQVRELLIYVYEDTLDKLLEHYVIDLDEYNELYQTDVDIIELV